MDFTCPRCNHPFRTTQPYCPACARPLPADPPIVPTKRKPGRSHRKKTRTGPHHRDNDPIAS